MRVPAMQGFRMHIRSSSHSPLEVHLSTSGSLLSLPLLNEVREVLLDVLQDTLGALGLGDTGRDLLGLGVGHGRGGDGLDLLGLLVGPAGGGEDEVGLELLELGLDVLDLCEGGDVSAMSLRWLVEREGGEMTGKGK